MTDTSVPTDQATRPGEAPGAPATAASDGCGCGGCGCGGGGAPASPQAGTAPQGVSIEGPVGAGELDLRGLPPVERHALVFGAVGALAPGEAVVIANDHDPLRLRAALEEQHPGQLTWQYLATGPTLWRVIIGRDSCC